MKVSDQDAVAVFCGSRPGTEPVYLHAAQSLGRAIVKAGKGLVYGGGNTGIMGAASRAVCQAGGRVTGVTPLAMLSQEWHAPLREAYTKNLKANVQGVVSTNAGNPSLNLKEWMILKSEETDLVETVIVHSIHDRKLEMAKRSSAFFCLPGGFGTFEEVLECVAWAQIGVHHKPIFILNILNFYEPLKDLISISIKAGFVEPQHEALVYFVDGPSDLSLHHSFDWGEKAIKAMLDWQKPTSRQPDNFDWNLTAVELIGRSTVKQVDSELIRSARVKELDDNDEVVESDGIGQPVEVQA